MMDANNLLSSVRDQSGESEAHMPMPAGYRPGQAKYVIVMGTVMSGLGKGIFSSSLARGSSRTRVCSVTPVKLEGYLNATAAR
jgi:CTP synthase